ncbi:MAG: SigE family RNA polymerase sigma factor [Frankiaceae bacterium]
MDPETDEAFAAFVAAQQGALLRTAYLLTGDRDSARDLVQTALAKTYLRWRHIRRSDAPEVYVRRVMVTTHAGWFRRRVDEVLHAVPPERADDDDEATAVAERDAMWALLRTLPPGQRACMVLRYYEDLSEREVAEVLGCSAGSVKRQTSRAMDKLRAALGGATTMEVSR